MSVEAPSKTIDHVDIRRMENGFTVLLHYRSIDPELPDSVTSSDAIERWQLEHELLMRNNVPKAYVFSTYESMTQFIQIQTGWS